MTKTLYCFDFDDTLCHTMTPDPGERMWFEKTGLDWPYQGWWSKPETLDPEYFHTPKNEWVYQKYLDARKDENSTLVLATGRLQRVPKMRENIERILNQHNFSFDEVWKVKSNDRLQNGNGEKGIYLNWGGDTFKFKSTLFETLIKVTQCDHFVMHDDREEHLIRFEDWAKEQSIPITIVDVVKKISTTFNEKNI